MKFLEKVKWSAVGFSIIALLLIGILAVQILILQRIPSFPTYADLEKAAERGQSFEDLKDKMPLFNVEVKNIPLDVDVQNNPLEVEIQ